MSPTRPPACRPPDTATAAWLPPMSPALDPTRPPAASEPDTRPVAHTAVTRPPLTPARAPTARVPVTSAAISPTRATTLDAAVAPNRPAASPPPTNRRRTTRPLPSNAAANGSDSVPIGGHPRAAVPVGVPCVGPRRCRSCRGRGPPAARSPGSRPRTSALRARPRTSPHAPPRRPPPARRRRRGRGARRRAGRASAPRSSRPRPRRSRRPPSP